MSKPVMPGTGRAERMRRRKIKRIALFASLAVIIVLLITASILLAFEISDMSDKIDKDDNNTTVPPAVTTDPQENPNEGYTAFMYDSAKMKEGPLVLVNKDHKYAFPSQTKNMRDIRSSRTKNADGNYSYSCDYNKLMNTEAIAAFNEMMDAFYKATGNSYALVTTAYRTAEEQDAMGLETKAGFSDHHTGYLVTIKFFMDGIMYDFRDSKFADDYKWLADHAYEYGFVVRYPDSKAIATGVSNYPNAYRYVGKAHSTYMHENALCLEEYVDFLKSHNFDGQHISVTDNGGIRYEIYRIAANTSGQTSILIPEGKKYSISGDNDGGFIITVTIS